jgi:hypothetical protein
MSGCPFAAFNSLLAAPPARALLATACTTLMRGLYSRFRRHFYGFALSIARDRNRQHCIGV